MIQQCLGKLFMYEQYIETKKLLFRLELGTGRNVGGKIVTPESKCPELLANYCDMLLRRTPLSKRLTSEEIELR